MKLFRSKLGLTFGLSYFGLYVLTGIYAVCFLLFRKPTPEFDPASLAVLPWSFILLPLAHAYGIADWYERFAGSPVLYGTLMTLVLLPGALLNAVIFYHIGKYLETPPNPNPK